MRLVRLLPAGRGARAIVWVAWALLAALCVASAWAEERSGPPDLSALLEAEPGVDLGVEFGEEKRRQAMRAATRWLWGAGRSGTSVLGDRAECGGEARGQSGPALRFPAADRDRHGFTLVPPVVGETRQAIRLGRDGRRAASAARVVRIVEPERLATSPPHWRDYLVRRWRVPEPPVSLLFPRDDREEADWARWIAEGWQ